MENLQFHQFSEWIDMEIKKQLYRRDAQFLELELIYIKKKEQEILMKKDQLTLNNDAQKERIAEMVRSKKQNQFKRDFLKDQ